MTQQRPAILLIGHGPATPTVRSALEAHFRCVSLDDVTDLVGFAAEGDFHGAVLTTSDETSGSESGSGGFDASALLLQSQHWLRHAPDAMAIVDREQRVLWENPQFRSAFEFDSSHPFDSKTPETTDHLTNGTAPPDGSDAPGGFFYERLGEPEMLGPDFCPLTVALGAGEPGHSRVKLDEKSFWDLRAVAVSDDPCETDPASQCVLVVLRDVSAETVEKQKREAIYSAGWELGGLAPSDIIEMSMAERTELLKGKILEYTKDVLQYDTIEVRLIDPKTGALEPLISSGMDHTAELRDLRPSLTGNGMTGYVAYSGNSYLCKDVLEDPLYLPGAPNARSTLTVPITLHGRISGTLNVESPQPGAFDETDEEFLEMFAKEIAVALNTLELLDAEKSTTESEAANRLLTEVATPIDEILLDASWILDKYIGHEPEVCERLQAILEASREVKRSIQKVGGVRTPDGLVGLDDEGDPASKYLGLRVLVIDEDPEVRKAARELLCRYGFDVEAVPTGVAATSMVRNFDYAAVLSDIRLPDMTGYECFSRLRSLRPGLPVILMTGFGYDPTHSIVQARQEGCRSVLYKPFRLDQLLGAIDEVTTPEDEQSDAPTQTVAQRRPPSRSESPT